MSGNLNPSLEQGRITDKMVGRMDNLTSRKDVEQFLIGLRIRVPEEDVRKIVNALRSDPHKYHLYMGGIDRKTGATRVPITSKGTADKIKKLYDEGELKPYLAYLSNSPTVGEAKVEQIKQAKNDVPKESGTGQVPYEETLQKQKMRELAGKLGTETVSKLYDFRSQLITQGVQIGGVGEIQEAFERLCLYGVVERREEPANPIFPGLRPTAYWVFTETGKSLIRYLESNPLVK